MMSTCKQSLAAAAPTGAVAAATTTSAATAATPAARADTATAATQPSISAGLSGPPGPPRPLLHVLHESMLLHSSSSCTPSATPSGKTCWHCSRAVPSWRTYIHTYRYIYIYICVCVCVCVYIKGQKCELSKTRKYADEKITIGRARIEKPISRLFGFQLEILWVKFRDFLMIPS